MTMKRTLVVFSLISVVSFGFASPKPGDFFTQGNSASKTIALTFDDGPGPNTESFLTLLDRYGIKATFFMQGTQVRLHPKTAKLVKEQGHEIGQHTFSHMNYNKAYKDLLKKMGENQKDKVVAEEREAVRQDMEKTQKLLADTVGERARLCRMPHGVDRPWIKEAAKDAGLILVNWTYGADWSKVPLEQLKKDYIGALKPGAIILLHDGWPKSDTSLALTEAILKAAQEKGLQIVPVGQLIGLSDPRQ